MVRRVSGDDRRPGVPAVGPGLRAGLGAEEPVAVPEPPAAPGREGRRSEGSSRVANFSFSG